MTRYTYVILSRAQQGREEEFRRWYAEQHLADVVRQPGVLSGRLLVCDLQKAYDLDPPQYGLMTIYELETDDPAATMEAIRLQAGSSSMPMTDSLEKSGMLQIVAHQIAKIDQA